MLQSTNIRTQKTKTVTENRDRQEININNTEMK